MKIVIISLLLSISFISASQARQYDVRSYHKDRDNCREYYEYREGKERLVAVQCDNERNDN